MSEKPKGKLILISGPSGSGKNVLIQHIRETHPEFIYLLSYTTRAKRPGQENSDYRFLSTEEFKKGIDSGNFLEWAQFGENFYGTQKEEILTAVADGKILLKEMDIQGVRQILTLLPRDEIASIFIDAGSWEELERRVRERAPITDEELAKRKMRYEDEITFKDEADFIIKNLPGELEAAKESLSEVITTIQNSVRA